MIAQKLKAFREKSGITQKHVGAELGIHVSVLCLIENGKRQPTLVQEKAIERFIKDNAKDD